MPKVGQEKPEDREKRKKGLLAQGIHVLDSVKGEAICGTTKKVTPHGPRDLALPCRSCGRDGLTVQLL